MLWRYYKVCSNTTWCCRQQFYDTKFSYQMIADQAVRTAQAEQVPFL